MYIKIKHWTALLFSWHIGHGNMRSFLFLPVFPPFPVILRDLFNQSYWTTHDQSPSGVLEGKFRFAVFRRVKKKYIFLWVHPKGDEYSLILSVRGPQPLGSNAWWSDVLIMEIKFTINVLCLNNPKTTPSPPLPSMKLVPGAKEVGDHHFKSSPHYL